MSIFIIAEIAQGYEGDPAQAKLLLAAAAAGGADAAKLQLVYADELATPDYEHYALFSKLEMADPVWKELGEFAKNKGIGFFLDVFGDRSLALAADIEADGIKVHSTDMGNPGLLAAIGRSAIGEVLLSVGGCSLDEIDDALSLVGKKNVTLLLGFQGYPTPADANQVRRLALLASRYGGRQNLRLGFADHADPESDLCGMLPALALGAGAVVFEKHLTLAKSMKLEDHESALNPDEFAEFSAALRECAQSLGSVSETEEFLGMRQSERLYREKTRKHVVARTRLSVGTLVSASDIALKRTSAKDAIQDARMVIGKRLCRSVERNAPLTPADFSK